MAPLRVAMRLCNFAESEIWPLKAVTPHLLLLHDSTEPQDGSGQGWERDEGFGGFKDDRV